MKRNRDCSVGLRRIQKYRLGQARGLGKSAVILFFPKDSQMKVSERVKAVFSNPLVVLILVVFSMRLLDLPLTAWISMHLRSVAPYVITSKLPDLSLVAVAILTSVSWVVYFRVGRQNPLRPIRAFSLVTGIVLPLAFGVKVVLKWMFGRTETRTWLSDPSMYGFHWFAGTKGFLGFPSGHMLVFTPLFLALWHFYPRYRVYYGVVWFCLGAALLATGYHFLSDVLAGAYIGAVVYLTITRAVA